MTYAPDPLRILAESLLQPGWQHALMLVDPDGAILEWMGDSERLFGYTAHEVRGASFSLLFTSEDRTCCLDRHELAVATRTGRAEDDRWHVRKDGARIWMTGSTVALRDAAGNLVGFGKMSRDRSDLRVQIDALASRLLALTAAEERRHLFLTTLGHELRNPLGPLTNAVHLIRSAKDISEVHRPLGVIERQGTLIKRLADDLMDLTRAAAGRLQLSPRRVVVQDVIEGLVTGFEAEAMKRGLQLEMLAPAAPIAAELDVERFEQVVMNLMQNALKYTPHGGHVWVKLDTSDDEVIVRVEDTGIGIAPEMLSRIFELFAQDQAAGDRWDGGLGLGLSVVKELVRLHGGTVEVRSPGHGLGSQFTARFPNRVPKSA